MSFSIVKCYLSFWSKFRFFHDTEIHHSQYFSPARFLFPKFSEGGSIFTCQLVVGRIIFIWVSHFCFSFFALDKLSVEGHLCTSLILVAPLFFFKSNALIIYNLVLLPVFLFLNPLDHWVLLLSCLCFVACVISCTTLSSNSISKSYFSPISSSIISLSKNYSLPLIWMLLLY